MSDFFSSLLRPHTPLILLLLTSMAVGCIGLGWQLGRAPLQVQLAQQSSAHAGEQAQRALNTVAILQIAQSRGDALTQELLTQQTQINQLKTEARRAITQATTGKPCLDGTALRLLNTAPGLAVAGVPQAASGPAAAGELVASDTDIAGWAVDTGAAFGICRARLDALIDWHTPPPTGPSGALHD